METYLTTYNQEYDSYNQNSYNTNLYYIFIIIISIVILFMEINNNMCNHKKVQELNDKIAELICENRLIKDKQNNLDSIITTLNENLHTLNNTIVKITQNIAVNKSSMDVINLKTDELYKMIINASLGSLAYELSQHFGRFKTDDHGFLNALLFQDINLEDTNFPVSYERKYEIYGLINMNFIDREKYLEYSRSFRPNPWVRVSKIH